MTQLVSDIAGCCNCVGNLLSQQRLIALPKSVERLADRILGHPQTCSGLRLVGPKPLSSVPDASWSPMHAAGFLQRAVCRRRFTLCVQHHAPVRCRERKAALLFARTACSRWSHLIRSRAHSTIQVISISESKPACRDGCRLRRGYREPKGMPALRDVLSSRATCVKINIHGSATAETGLSGH